MLTIESRKKSENLQDYHLPDFRGKKWDAITNQSFSTAPVAARFEVDEAIKPKWEVLGVGEFDNHIEAMEPTEDGTIAYDLCFSPPKSFSLAALTGEEISLELLRIHRDAVTQALMFVMKYLVTRKTPKKRRFLERIPQVIWRFVHPWNDQMEPQLHEHALLLASKPGELV